MMDVYRRGFESRGLDYAVWGHISDGNVHPNVIPHSYEDVVRGKEAILEFGREVLRRLGGCPLAEHGVGRNPVKQALLRQLVWRRGASISGCSDARRQTRAGPRTCRSWKLAPGVYFNASLQGLEQLFAAFRPLRKGVAPYQMPSFAVGMILRTFLHHTQAHRYPHGRRLTSLLHHVVALDLTEFDIYFKEEEALKLAAGTYYAGVKEVTPTSTLVPAPIRDLWQQDAGLQRRFPDLNQLTTTDNILTWAKTEGRRQHAEVARCLDAIAPAHKRGAGAPWDRGPIHALPLIEPLYGAIGFDPTNTMAENARVAVKRPGPSLYTRLRRRASRVPLLRRLYAAVVKQGGA
jgi:hypothetical protein